MTVQNALEEMKERAFAPAFQKYLFDTYKVLAQTDFSEEEKDYTAAEDYFTTTLEVRERDPKPDQNQLRGKTAVCIPVCFQRRPVFWVRPALFQSRSCCRWI